MSSEKNYSAIDLLKLLLSFGVVYMHTSPLGYLLPEINHVLNNLIFRLAVPFFIIASAYFFFTKNTTDRYKQIKRVAILWSGWVCIYFLYDCLVQKKISIGYIFDYIFNINIFNIGGAWQFWYFPSLIILLLFLSHFGIRSLKSLAVIGVVIYMIGVFGDSYYIFSNEQINKIINFNNHYFFSPRNSLMNTLILGVIGAYTSVYDVKVNYKFMFAFLFVVCAYIIEFAFINNAGGWKDLNMYLSLPLISLFIFLLALNSRFSLSNNVSKYIRYTSTIVFSSHFLFMKIYDDYKLSALLQNNYLKFLFVMFFSLALSLFIIELSKKTSFKLLKSLY
ncbi:MULTISPECIES: acyltransferase [Marinomonas]|uniref:Acyltransferase n=1 Tax=Marinomonas rhodophyticola TaxID=2992803 RepID=A0ABT3KIZ2_9GAMM|nr:acyltransferase [Marinomonas sp. KJ51-3]MCW4630522.1 acyltransferase [Marinomonas sp. KJ51-3]